jgi:lipopolysaccharide transport system ATP-binding protein
MGAVIKVENLSKQYRLGDVGTGSLKDDLKRFRYRLMGKEDPFLKVGEVNERTKKSSSDYVWALKDINFDIEQGDVVGIIGRNGAGKSTLLKILSRTTAPTTGTVKVKGRIASLLEVGTGFHGELSGRENIYLNGAIMGLRKWEIDKKLDEIIDFAGVEKYLDTPVKRYSSGMYVRLAFAVSAHLEPDILIVDEVLAVGDSEFQKKALGKMKNVSGKDGRTVAFVSHNMGAIKALCTRAILMKNGSIDFDGSTQTAIRQYLGGSETGDNAHFVNEKPKTESDILNIKIVDSADKICNNFGYDQPIKIVFDLKVAGKHLDAYFGIRVRDQLERNIFTSEVQIKTLINKEGMLQLSIDIPGKLLVPNKYSLNVAFHKPNVEIIQLLEDRVQFVIEETGTDFFHYNGADYGCVLVDCKWNKIS